MWEDIERLVADVSDDAWAAATPLPGWCVRDVVAHIIGTESMLQGAPTPDADIAGLDHVRNPIGEMNERWIRSLSGLSTAEVLDRYRRITAERRAVLAAMGEDDWNAQGFTPAGQDSYGRFMRIRTFDCWMHEQDIRDGLSQPPSEDDLASPAAGLSLDEMTASMGFVVGKKGGAPEGARVAIELTGRLSRVIRVAVNGRAAVVDDFGGADPTAVIRLDGLEFTRLAGGRASASASIEYSGDAELGRRVVANLAYVI